MDYVSVEDAKNQGGLRLALTMGVPGPWSQAAKFIFEFKKFAYIPVAQKGGRDNPELFAWTGHRNAPVAVYQDEAPRVGWHEIIMLAERIAPEPSLLPRASAQRAEMFGLITEIASEGGFAWLRRLSLIGMLFAASDDPKLRRTPEVLAARYGYSPAAAARAEAACAGILAMLAEKLRAQAVAGSGYFVGDAFTAADLYWAAFSQLVAPMAEDLNPMPPVLRRAYQAPATLPIDAVLIAHRDMIYDRHLGLPLDF
mgnify:CR=1 FL=1